MNPDIDILFALNGNGTPFFDTLITTCTSTLTWVPFFIGAIIMLWKSDLTIRQTGLILAGALVALLIADGVAEGIVKPAVQRLRPCNEPSLAQHIHIVNGYRNNDYSFFSGHATNTSMLAIYLFTLVRQRLFGCTVVAWSLLNCYTRLYLAQHYPTDIIVGILWGSIVGFTMATIIRTYIRKEKSGNEQLRTLSQHAWIPMTGLALSLFYSIVRATLT